MGKLSIIGRVFDRFCISSDRRSSCFCVKEEFDEYEREGLIEESEYGGKQPLRVKDVMCANQTLAFHLKPKMVVLRVSMHCHGCAKKVQKHISKMEGVISYEVDMEKKMVVILGDIVPYQVLESVSKVKNAEFWSSPSKS